MTRQEKYQDTKTFHFYNANPKGRITGDCVIRALCTAMQRPYEEVYKELFEFSLSTGYMLNDKKCYEKWLEKKGWKKMKQPRHGNNTKYTGEEFCKAVGPRVIANIGGHHIVAIIDHRIWDIWDSSKGTIGNFWIPAKLV